MILITGAAGFIGSALIWRLNEDGITDIIAVDSFHSGDKWKNLRKRDFHDWVDRDALFDWLDNYAADVDTIIHLGACTDTTERDMDYFIRVNYTYSKRLWRFAVEKNIPFLYASSAATYGAGENGYKDDEQNIPSLVPLNPYGWSKQIFDRWVLSQEETPPSFYGFKFFNVYGPNEYHKGHMSSTIYHAHRQAVESGTIKLFKSYRNDVEHGEQKRDFIYVKDVVSIVSFFMDSENRGSTPSPPSGIYNVGTGRAASFNDLADAVFGALHRETSITYFDMPDDLRGQYQYYTEAPVEKLRRAGYSDTIRDLKSGVDDYIRCHLSKNDKYL
jgi:ADP-L-glycero-D-manno-heptose 6-epimerase